MSPEAERRGKQKRNWEIREKDMEQKREIEGRKEAGSYRSSRSQLPGKGEQGWVTPDSLGYQGSGLLLLTPRLNPEA